VGRARRTFSKEDVMKSAAHNWLIPLVALAAAAGVAGGAMVSRHIARGGVDKGGTGAAGESQILAIATDLHPDPLVLQAGTRVSVRMESAISSESARVGDEFQAALTEPWLVNGRVGLPVGTRIEGQVSQVEPTGRGKHKALLVLRFLRAELSDGGAMQLEARPVYLEAEGETRRDVEMIGGGTLLGGIVGKVTGNTGRGAVVGAAVGTGAALETKGDPVIVRPGRMFRLFLQRDALVPARAARS
jgi:hypothetical protein